MNIRIRQMLPKDADAKGFVHWRTWQETYVGLMPERFLSNQTLEKCQSIAHRWPGNTLVAELGGTIVGFGCYIPGETGCGEISAIYLLKEAQGMGIGRKLMDALVDQLAGCETINLWVLKGNDNAVGFYEHYGFRLTGIKQNTAFGIELQMCYQP